MGGRKFLGSYTALKANMVLWPACYGIWAVGQSKGPLSLSRSAGVATTILSACLLGVGTFATSIYIYLRGKDSFVPDYSEENVSWFAFEREGGKRADLFYAHPTTHAGLARWNLAWEDMGDVCTGPVAGDPDLIKGQAAAWAEEANVYAPKYRQMGFMAQGKDLETTDAHLNDVKASLDLAVGDLERAFAYFLKNRPDPSRPFIIAAHSQGAILMSKVMATTLQGSEHECKLVAAYLCGAYLPIDLFSNVFTSIKACTSPTDTNCIISYDTRTAEFKPESLNHIAGSFGLWAHHLHWLLHDRYTERPTGTDDVGKARLQINPATWTTQGGGEHLGASLSSSMAKPPKGAVKGEPLIAPPGWASKITTNHYSVCIPDATEWWKATGSLHGNLHAIDVQFWFYNHRENVKRRLDAWDANTMQK